MDSEADTFNLLEYIGENSTGLLLEEDEPFSIEDFDAFITGELTELEPSNYEIEGTAGLDYFAEKVRTLFAINNAVLFHT